VGAIVRRYQEFTFKAEYAYDHGHATMGGPKSITCSHPFTWSGCFSDVIKYYHFSDMGTVMRLSKYVQGNAALTH